MKRNNKKGFTLAELLIVVAIIAVLVAIAIPVFGSKLEQAREAVDLANLRTVYAQAQTDFLTKENGAVSGASISYPFSLKQTGYSDWKVDTSQLVGGIPTGTMSASISKVTVTFDDNGFKSWKFE